MQYHDPCGATLCLSPHTLLPGSSTNYPDGEAQVNEQLEQRLRAAQNDMLQPLGRKSLASFSFRSVSAHDKSKRCKGQRRTHSVLHSMSAACLQLPGCPEPQLPTHLTSSPAKSNTLVIVTFPESFGFSDSFGFS